VPDLDVEHLTDALTEYMVKVGLSHAFQMGDYENIEVQQAVRGDALAKLHRFIQPFLRVQPAAEYKYSDLKAVFQTLYNRHRELADQARDTGRSVVVHAGHLAERTMVVFNHLRRIARDRTRRDQCTDKVSEYQKNLLLRMCDDVVLAEKAPVSAKEPAPSEASELPATQELDALLQDVLADAPSPPPKTRQAKGDPALDLLQAAMAASPVPPSKRARNALVDAPTPEEEKAQQAKQVRTKTSKVEAQASPLTKAAAKAKAKAKADTSPSAKKQALKGKQGTTDYHLMCYNNPLRYAVREKHGTRKQVFQLSSPTLTAEKLRAVTEEAMIKIASLGIDGAKAWGKARCGK